MDPVSIGLIAAVVSSFRDKIIEEGVVIFGEVGLTGEVRAVSHVEQRINEAIKLGFKKCIIPKGNADNIKVKGIKIVAVENVEDMLNHII